MKSDRATVWREEALARHHDRNAFDCGTVALNEYLKCYARQNSESGGARTFVAVNPGQPTAILGYYTISPGAIAFVKIPAKITKTLGRYEVPVFRLGRLAVALKLQGRGLGADLLYAAGERALAVAREVGGVGLAIDAKDERAAQWYERFGALRLIDDSLKLILPLETIRAALRAE
ncbi:MAG: GNAT family N-acetyltransferase [Acidobacteriota bacterium]|nr:GNAT family N-acetyltransferase [Acidobacteriota bacterium]